MVNKVSEADAILKSLGCLLIERKLSCRPLPSVLKSGVR